MRLVLTSIFIIISVLASSQTREIHIKSNPVGDLPYWFTNRVETCNQLDLEQVHLTEHPWYFRLSTDRQSISLWWDVDDNHFGTVINWAEEYVPEGEIPTGRIHFNTVHLNSSKVDSLLQVIDGSKTLDIPDQDEIEGWSQGLDGIVYIFETVDEHNYWMKTYWSPTAQDSLHEAIRIQEFVDQVWTICDASRLWKEFSSTVPYECFRSGGITLTCKVLTRREKRKYRKERENYRQQNQQ